MLWHLWSTAFGCQLLQWICFQKWYVLSELNVFLGALQVMVHYTLIRALKVYLLILLHKSIHAALGHFFKFL